MKITCGTDMIEIERVKESIEQLGERFLNRIYTEDEIDYCESKKQQKYQHYAARFAAKEAAFKAISKKLDNKYDVEWKQFEITNNEQGRPILKLNGIINNSEIEDIDISISHCKKYAVANVVIMWEK